MNESFELIPIPKSSRSKTLRSKTIRTSSSKSSYSPDNMVIHFLEFSNTLKLFHWKTDRFALHKATDDLYGSLGGRIDTFVEQLMGILNKRVNIGSNAQLVIHDCSNPSDFLKHVVKFKNYLEHMSFPSPQYDLMAVRDEMLGDINKFLYLYTLG